MAARAARSQSPPDSAPAAHARLFDANDALRLTLTADFGALGHDRGTSHPNHAGVLSYVTAAGDSVSLPVQLHTRGHFRLAECQFPPLKVVFDREQTAHTIFAHQGSLKLTGQCRGNRSYANYVQEEYLIYRMYNLLTERSFRARFARLTYVDAKGKHDPETRNAFFVEDDDRMARRNGMQVLQQKNLSQADMEYQQMGLLAVFQYMIGNTDWSVAALHNIVLARDSTGNLYPVPYDFDWSGVIWTPYAHPDSRLGIATVRERTFRGVCRTEQELTALFARFNEQQSAFEALYHGPEAEGLEPKRVSQALDYYAEFYKIINDPGRARREFSRNCLG